MFYIPKLERMEEGLYVNELYRTAETLLQKRVGVSQYSVGKQKSVNYSFHLTSQQNPLSLFQAQL